jgi:hypothetical protein
MLYFIAASGEERETVILVFYREKRVKSLFSRSGYEHAVLSSPISRRIIAVPEIYAGLGGCYV